MYMNICVYLYIYIYTYIYIHIYVIVKKFCRLCMDMWVSVYGVCFYSCKCNITSRRRHHHRYCFYGTVWIWLKGNRPPPGDGGGGAFCVQWWWHSALNLNWIDKGSDWVLCRFQYSTDNTSDRPAFTTQRIANEPNMTFRGNLAVRKIDREIKLFSSVCRANSHSHSQRTIPLTIDLPTPRVE